jgi:D-alanyl-D-alanine carboxypeptidase
LVLIGIAAAIKIDQGREDTNPHRASWTDYDIITDVDIDPNFYVDNPNTSPGTASTSTSQPGTRPVVAVPKITAKSYIVGSIKTGKIYIQKNPDIVMPLASMTKILTALIATRNKVTTPDIEITAKDLEAPADESFLKLGEKYTTDEILYPLLITSSNVAAEAIADTAGRDNFSRLMSDYSQEIGMDYSAFQDPSGVSMANVSTAHDMFNLAKYIFVNEPQIISITKTPRYTISTTTDHGYHVLISTHPFVNEPTFMGGKTGYTPQAGETMVTVMDIDGDAVAFIVFNSLKGKREADTRELISRFKALNSRR